MKSSRIHKKIYKKKKNSKFIFIDNHSTNNIIYNQINNETIVLLDYNNYIYPILKSYKTNSSNISNQFKNDFPRANYKINNLGEKNISIFIDYFEFLLHQCNLNFNEFLMLCTQAIMGTPLEILYKTIYNKNIYIGELQNNMPLDFNIITKNNNIFIIAKKTLRFFYINTNGYDTTINLISINLHIPFSTKEKIIITYKILKNK